MLFYVLLGWYKKVAIVLKWYDHRVTQNIWQENHSVAVEVRHGYDRAEKNETDMCFTVTSDFLQMCDT